MPGEEGNSINIGTKRLAPPRLTEDLGYRSWKNKIQMWKLVCGVDKKEQGIIILLQSLNGNKKAEKAVANLTADTLFNNGLNIILEKLDAVFQSEEVEDAYFTYSKFSSFKRQQNMTIHDYIIEFENLNFKMDNHNMKLPDKVLAFKVLDGASVSENQRQMCLTLANDLTYNSMKAALKRIFGDKISNLKDENCYDDVYVKQEESAMIFEHNKSKKKLNPVNKQGKISRCVICDSKMHWAKNCPHKSIEKEKVNITESTSDNESDNEEVNIILMTNEYEILINEMEINAVIDTACTKTVSGENWFQNYLKCLDDTGLNKVKIIPSKKTFKFGDGRKVISKFQATIPATIGSHDCFIRTEVVNEKNPLLLSKTSLKKAETLLNLKEDKVKMFNEDIDVHYSSNGHYAVRILPEKVCNFNDGEHVLIFENDDSIKKKKAKLIKLHKQFGHASSNNLKSLIKNAGHLNEEISNLIDEVSLNCDICKKYKKVSPRPVVGLPRATDFNQSVAMDLHYIDKNLWYFHMIDEFSRYSNAVIVKSKQPEVIIQNFIQNWISIFGSPIKIFSDNGGEFVSEELTDFCENFNIKVSTSAAESPWSNGICERHNAILTEILLKVREDIHCSWEVALAWAVNAKNSFINVSGFSPHQLVFGRNVNLPNAINDQLSAGYSEKPLIIKHLNAMYSAREAFMKIESSNKLRTALRRQTRKTRDFFNLGQEVYYKRNNDIKWKGPGKVIGQDGPVVFVRHGGHYVKVHCTRIQVSNNDKEIENDLEQGYNQTNQNIDTNSKFEQHLPETVEDSYDSDIDDEIITIENKDLNNSQNSVTNPDPNSTNPPAPSDQLQTNDIAELTNQLSNININDQESSNLHNNKVVNKEKLNLKKGQLISYTLNDIPYTVEILGRAGKATGSYKNSFNVEYKELDQEEKKYGYVDFDKVDNLKVINIDEEEVFQVDSDFFQSAKESELINWQKNDVFEEVPYIGQKTISLKWVYTLKNIDDKTFPKARLVAKGFEEDSKDIPKDSPTCSKEVIRTMLALTAQKEWKLNAIDIKAAFLQGDEIDRELYVIPPKEANTTNIWRIKKCVYGLGDASRRWYNSIKNYLLSIGLVMSKADPALFYYHKDNNLIGMIAIHVDDFLWSGAKEFEINFISKLRNMFVVGKENQSAFKYLGINLVEKNSDITIDQINYSENIKPIKLTNNETIDKDHLQSQIGKLLWISSQTRPDIAFDVCQLGTNFKNSGEKEIKYANKVLTHLKQDSVQIKYKYLGKNDDLKLVIYADASHGNLCDGGSQSGYLIFLVGENRKSSLINWQSKRIKRVVRSSLAAETLALSDAIDDGVYISELISELFFNGSKQIPIEVYTDSKSLFDALNSKKKCSRKKIKN